MTKTAYPFSIGDYQGFVLHDASSIHTADELIANPCLEELGHLAKEYSFALDEIPVDYINLLIQAEDQQVLVDAGIPRPMGKLFSGLEELGLEPGDIHTVVITHADLDHIGGILNQEGGISFPNARYILLEDAWQYWSSEEKRTALTTLNKWTEDKAQYAWETLSKIKDRIHRTGYHPL